MRVDMGNAVILSHAGGVVGRRLNDREAQAASPQVQYALPITASQSDDDDGIYEPSEVNRPNWDDVRARIAEAEAKLAAAGLSATARLPAGMVDKTARDSFSSAHLMVKLTVAMADNIQNRLAKETDVDRRSSLDALASENLDRFNRGASTLHSLFEINGDFPTLEADNRFSRSDYSVVYKGEELGRWKW